MKEVTSEQLMFYLPMSAKRSANRNLTVHISPFCKVRQVALLKPKELLEGAKNLVMPLLVPEVVKFLLDVSFLLCLSICIILIFLT